MVAWNRKTQEEFVKDAAEVHGSKYTYELTEYMGLQNKVDVTCTTHGKFSIGAGKLLQGQGCQKCSKECTGKPRHTLAEFTVLAEKTHGNKYDYSFVDLKRDCDEIEIVCNKHGTSFWQKPSSHKQGGGCPICARESATAGKRLTTEKFVEKSRSVHGDKYDYSKSSVIGNGWQKVEIVCPKHEPFWMSPNHHGQGRGCPKCSWEGSGYSQTKPGSFYILRHEAITKVGITNRKVIERIKGINRDSGLDFKLHSSVFSEDGAKARNIELQVLAWLKLHYKNVETKFDGYTECFLDVDVDALMSFVVPIS